MNFEQWQKDEIIYKDNIYNFDFLISNAYIKEIEDGYFYLTVGISQIEGDYYDMKIKELAEKLGIKDIDTELKHLIKELNEYNEIKDISDALIGKLAELKGVTIKELNEEFGIDELK